MTVQTPRPLEIAYYSDVLCIHAYATEARIDALLAEHGGDVRLERRFCSSFGNTESKIGQGWKQKGGWEAYAAHVQEIAARVPHVEVGADVWRGVRPVTSHSAHVFLKALQMVDGPTSDAATWALRRAFFAEARDVADWEVQREVAEAAGADVDRAQALMRDGRAFAALAADYDKAVEQKIEGSPTFVFPEGREKLYGDVGYRIISANVTELLRAPSPDAPGWC